MNNPNNSSPPSEGGTKDKTVFDHHGYFFARLPKEKNKRAQEPKVENDGSGVANHASIRPKLWTGRAKFILTVKSPVHVGDGSFRLTEPYEKVPGGVSRSIYLDSDNRSPIIPGSSLKGAFRSIAEAASKSCISSADMFNYKEQSGKFPKRHRPQERNIPIQLSLKEVGHLKHCNQTESMCPCCAIFGLLGYKGRLTFSQAHLPEGQTFKRGIAYIPALDGPHIHRIGDKNKPDSLRLAGNKVQINNIQGRRFYPHIDYFGTLRGPNPRFHEEYDTLNEKLHLRRDMYVEPVDVIPIGTQMEFEMSFENLELWELGLVLFAMGIEQEWIPKIGGGKAVGLGSVRVEVSKLWTWDVRGSYLHYAPQEKLHSSETLAEAILVFWEREDIVNPEGIKDIERGLAEELEPDYFDVR